MANSGFEITLYLLVGLTLMSYFVFSKNPNKTKYKNIITACSLGLVLVVILVPIDYEIKMKYLYPIIGGLFMPEMLSLFLKKIQQKLKILAGLSAEDEKKEVPLPNNKKRKEPEVVEDDEVEDEEDFVVIKDKELKERSRLKRKTKRTRKIDFNE